MANALVDIIKSGDKDALNQYLTSQSIGGDASGISLNGQPNNALSNLLRPQPQSYGQPQGMPQQPMEGMQPNRTITNATLGYGPQGVTQPQQYRGSPVDVFGQGKGYMQPDGTIVGTNAQGQQFKVQDEGTDAARQAQIDAMLKRQMMRAQIDQEKAKTLALGQKIDGVGQAKPLPPKVMSMQIDMTDAIGTAASINADLGSLVSKIDAGKLNPSMLNNAEAWVRQNTNSSNEESRNLMTFKATLEKLRNDSLRLNKGVQTDGDAQRAWNEILTNINDKEYVKQRLIDIQGINKRAIELKKHDLNIIRSEYNHEPLDVSGYENVGTALSGSNAGNLPANNAQGWTLHVDASGNKAYVSPDGTQFKEVR